MVRQIKTDKKEEGEKKKIEEWWEKEKLEKVKTITNDKKEEVAWLLWYYRQIFFCTNWNSLGNMISSRNSHSKAFPEYLKNLLAPDFPERFPSRMCSCPNRQYIAEWRAVSERRIITLLPIYPNNTANNTQGRMTQGLIWCITTITFTTSVFCWIIIWSFQSPGNTLAICKTTTLSRDVDKSSQ